MAHALERPSLNEITTLITVIELKSFTKAARKLAMSPPRVSEMVRSIEERLGVRLVERTTRSVAPTAAGEQLLARFRPLLDEYQAAIESVNLFRSKPAGNLRLVVVPPAANFVLAPTIPRFLQRYPEINIEISVAPGHTDIVAERFDAGIDVHEQVDSDMVALRVSDEIPYVVVGSPAYLARAGIPQTPRDLAQHDCIRFSLPGDAVFPWRFLINGRVTEFRTAGRYLINVATLAVRAAIDGVGLLQVPLPYVGRDLAEGRLVRLLDEWSPQPGDGLFLYYPSRRQNRAPFQALLDFLREDRGDM